MGFRISWMGFDGKNKASALEMVGLKDTGEPDEINETPFSGAEIVGGWFILFSNDFGFVSRERLAQLSVDCQIVACQVHEGIMFSAAYGYDRGRRVWELAHNLQLGTYDLSVFGSPPASFESIRQHLTQEQEVSPRRADYIFNIPIEVAAAICKYRHAEWSPASFTRLEVR